MEVWDGRVDSLDRLGGCGQRKENSVPLWLRYQTTRRTSVCDNKIGRSRNRYRPIRSVVAGTPSLPPSSPDAMAISLLNLKLLSLLELALAVLCFVFQVGCFAAICTDPSAVGSAFVIVEE